MYVEENGLTMKTVAYGAFHLGLMVMSATLQVLSNPLKKNFATRKHKLLIIIYFSSVWGPCRSLTLDIQSF